MTAFFALTTKHKIVIILYGLAGLVLLCLCNNVLKNTHNCGPSMKPKFSIMVNVSD